MGIVVTLQRHGRGRGGPDKAIVDGGAEIVILPCVRRERRDVLPQQAAGFVASVLGDDSRRRQELPVREPKAV